MPSTRRVYLEVGAKRVFAGALDWPGWCRSARDSDGALDALLAYAPRYATAIGDAGGSFKPPAHASTFEVVERLEGNSTTDFGAPGKRPSADDEPLTKRDADRLVAILRACWKTFDRVAVKHEHATLRKGPRGGGRELAAIVRHVSEGDLGYQWELGGTLREATDAKEVRRVFLATLASRARGEEPTRKRRSGTFWTPRYAVRRSAWHVLDHAWEIEDRANPRS